jgi:hypothetical protein
MGGSRCSCVFYFLLYFPRLGTASNRRSPNNQAPTPIQGRNSIVEAIAEPRPGARLSHGLGSGAPLTSGSNRSAVPLIR